jgi:hypothetical protein
MAVILNNWAVWIPNNSPPSAAFQLPASNLVPSSRGGALTFLYHSGGGSTLNTYIFSPIGYTQCTLTPDQKYYAVLPTFGTDKPKPNIQKIQATSVEVSDEAGTALFMNFDPSNGSKWPVAFFPRSGYLWIYFDIFVKGAENGALTFVEKPRL